MLPTPTHTSAWLMAPLYTSVVDPGVKATNFDVSMHRPHGDAALEASHTCIE